MAYKKEANSQSGAIEMLTYVCSAVFMWMTMTMMALEVVQATITYPLVPHHVQQMRRHRALEQFSVNVRAEEDHSLVRRRDIAQQMGALYQGYGTHYVDLWCGSPPQRQTVIVDTGSGVTAFPCTGCKNCGVPRYHIDELFNVEKSSTFEHNTCAGGCMTTRSHCSTSECKISMSYAEGSRWDAFEAIDTCYIGGPHERPLLEALGTEDLDPRIANQFAFDLTFGCQTLLTGLFKTQMADGIMGMDSRNEAFWNQMYKAGKMGDDKQFSLCFSRSPTAERKGTEAGALTLGGVDERLATSPMVYTPNASGGRSGFFSVRVRRVWMRDGSAGESAMSTKKSPSQDVKGLEVPHALLNSGGIIVDSGTTDTYWNRAIASAFENVFQQMAGRPYSNTAWSLTHEELLALPTILFQLESSEIANADHDAFKTTGLAGSLDPKHPNDVLLAFPPSHYMEYDPDTGKYTSRFYATERGGSVLGANAMMGHNILFDADKDQIGWSESDCDYHRLVTDAGYDFSISGNLETAPPQHSETEMPISSAPVTSVPKARDTTSPVQTAAPAAHPPVTPPSATPRNPPATNPTSTSKTSAASGLNVMATSVDDAFRKFLEACDTAECRYPTFIGLTIMACCGACLSYLLARCCCSCLCRDEGSETDYKYQPAPADEVELVSYCDEAQGDEEEEKVISATNGHGRFRDSPPKKQPEFQGDFI